MAKLNINAFGSMFVIVDDTGKPFGSKMYNTERGARQAITKAGHTYTEVPKAVKAPKPAKVSKPVERSNLTEDEILELHKDCLEAAGFVSGMTSKQVKACDWAGANSLAKKGGFSHYMALSKVAKGIKWSRKSTGEKTEIVQKQETRKADKESDKVAIETGELDAVSAQARNALARVNGFPRYRELCRAAERGDDKAKAAKAMIDRSVPFATFAKTKAA